MKKPFTRRTRRILAGAATGVLLLQPSFLPTRTHGADVDPHLTLQNAVDRELRELYGTDLEVAAREKHTARAASKTRVRRIETRSESIEFHQRPTITALTAAYANRPPERVVTAQGVEDVAEVQDRPRLVRTSHTAVGGNRRTVAAPAQRPISRGSNEVLRELRKLYRENGQEMPPMDASRLPNTTQGPHTVGLKKTPEVRLKPQSEEPQGGIRGFFRKLNPFHRAKPRVARQPRMSPETPQTPQAPPAGRVVETAPRELPAQVRNDRKNRLVVPPTAQHVPPPPTDFADPFTEVSEAEADRRIDAATGMKLTDAPAPQAKPEITAVAQQAAEEKPVAESKPDPRLERIAERSGNGFKGFCPVALRDERKLVDANSEYFTVVDGRAYQFSSAEAKRKFETDPEPYLPVSGGNDPVLLEQAGAEVTGSLDHAVWFHDRLHLFSSADTLAAFVATIETGAE